MIIHPHRKPRLERILAKHRNRLLIEIAWIAVRFAVIGWAVFTIINSPSRKT